MFLLLFWDIINDNFWGDFVVDITDVRKRDYYRVNSAYKTLLFQLRLEATCHYNSIHSVYNLYDEYGNRNFLFVGDGVYYLVDTAFEFADSVTFFKVNEFNNIVSLVPFKSKIIMQDGSVFRLDDKNNKMEEILLVDNDGKDKYRNINASLIYAQYNYKNVTRCSMFNHYEAKFDGIDKISEGCFSLPFLITMDQFAKVIDDNPKIDYSYHLTEWDPSVYGYSLALLKEFGVKRFINRKTEQLSFSRYYQDYVKIGDEVSIMAILKNRGYSWEKMQNIFKVLGFKSEVPTDLIMMFNGDDKEYSKCCDVLEGMANVSPKNNVKLILKR